MQNMCRRLASLLPVKARQGLQGLPLFCRHGKYGSMTDAAGQVYLV